MQKVPPPPAFPTILHLFCHFYLGAIYSFVVLYFFPCLPFLVIIFMKHTFSLCPVNLGPIIVLIALLPHGACPQFSVSVIVIIYYWACFFLLLCLVILVIDPPISVIVTLVLLSLVLLTFCPCDHPPMVLLSSYLLFLILSKWNYAPIVLQP